jgi:hypothetical protein
MSHCASSGQLFGAMADSLSRTAWVSGQHAPIPHREISQAVAVVQIVGD